MKPGLEAQIKQFQPIDGAFYPLEECFEEAFSTSDPSEYYDAIFNLFEQFPEDDGAGVFWSALHGMEEVGGYESQLIDSFRRHPSEMTRAMLIRLRNSGVEEIGSVRLDSLI